jgi:hypothetical protein
MPWLWFLTVLITRTLDTANFSGNHRALHQYQSKKDVSSLGIKMVRTSTISYFCPIVALSSPLLQWIAEPLSRYTTCFLQSSPHGSCRPPPTNLRPDKLSPPLTSLPPILQSRSRPAPKRRSHVLSYSGPYTRLSPIAFCHHASFLTYAQRQQSCSVPYTQIYNVSSKRVAVRVHHW